MEHANNGTSRKQHGPIEHVSQRSEADSGEVAHHTNHSQRRAHDRAPDYSTQASQTDPSDRIIQQSTPLSHNHPSTTFKFRTNEEGYPVLPSDQVAEPAHEAEENWHLFGRFRQLYTGKKDGDLRHDCEVNGLATYGRTEQLVERLAEKALRDYRRGFSGTYEIVGRMTWRNPPSPPQEDGGRAE
ncbi:hypothetical protein BU26DRAFT_559814 [Trematosphaeria pertusa]|uniref:Uncharacterized protein n=1 Tax=Trematosphaeria pertusa TaxID=390896 RepID=A0A6A6J032_9PLEO|nr:uncharacterized protein BU26DRAFT_559814 [Trematosphaeria pertusa]KAF2255200.1 hypothetical protein BU26DRAFT_559814 [Trematosphaeria pertusa]